MTTQTPPEDLDDTSKNNTEPFTLEDRQKLDDIVEGCVDQESREKIKTVLRPGGIRNIMNSYQSHVRSIEDSLLIMDKWNPRNKRTEKKIGPNNEVLGLPKGNRDDVNELEMDAIALAALNSRIALVWSMSKSAVNRAKSNLEIVRAEAKKAAAEARRAGHLRGKIKTVDQIENLAKTVKAVKDLEEDLLAVQEQAEILGGHYFASKDMLEVLMHRAKGLRSEEYRAKLTQDRS